MEALIKLNASEIDATIIESIKKLFEGKDVIIQITSVSDDTSYLLSSKVNKEHLIESMTEEPDMIFTPKEFENHVKELISSSEKNQDQ